MPIVEVGRAADLAIRALARLGLFPHEFYYPVPFKIFEFRELVRGVDGPGQRWLDLGCGNGFFTLLLAARCGEIVGVDPSPEYIRLANYFASVFPGDLRASFHCATLEELGFEGESFDKAFSFCVIEHIDNYREVLREIHRLLKPGGELIFSADSLETIEDPALIRKHREDSRVVRYFRKGELEGVLGEAGFRDVAVSPLFCSAYARDLFMRGIRNRFVFGRISPLLLYRKLVREERKPAEGEGKGIYLVARARKGTADRRPGGCTDAVR